MTGHILELRGCSPAPLGNYLKALGIFRLIGEQADPHARAWWQRGVFNICTQLEKEQLVEFFTHGIGPKRYPVYSPTPIFAPWGGRPGFFKDGNAKAKARLDSFRNVEDSTGRFRQAKTALRAIESMLQAREWTGLTKKQRDTVKDEIICECRKLWGTDALDWFDACIAIEEGARFGFLYGTGGNEGSADITNNFWELIEEVIGFPTPKSHSTETLVNAVFGDARMAGTKRTAGQHFPSAAGSANSGQTFFGSTSTNPWDVVLMMEGCVLFSGAATKRLSQYGKGKAAFPFMIDHLATANPSSSEKDEAKQDASVIRCRAEFWMPIWKRPLFVSELQSLLIEGRLQRSSGEPAEHTLHAMESVAGLSVSRGITAFERIGLFERRGKGYYVASSLGRIAVPKQASRIPPQLADLNEFRRDIYRNLREGAAIPARVLRSRSLFHDCLAALLNSREIRSINDDPPLALDVLVSVAALETEVATLRDREQLLRPCRRMPRYWSNIRLEQSEHVIARAVASLSEWGDVKSSHIVSNVRSNLLPVSKKGDFWVWDDTARSCAWSRGASLEGNMADVLKRRLIDMQRGDGDGLPLWSPNGASFASLLAYWEGKIDDGRLAELIHGLALVDYGCPSSDRIERWQISSDPTPSLHGSGIWFTPDEDARVRIDTPKWNGKPLLGRRELEAAFALPRLYCLLKLCFLGGRLPARPVERTIAVRSGTEPFPPNPLDILNLLLGGRASEAVSLAMRRLRVKGLPSILDVKGTDSSREIVFTPRQCRRMAGMLLIPVRHPGVLAALVIKPTNTTD